jgi:uncharacterized protein YPO0396
MLDNGYSLLRVELLNWGNFHGLQKFQLRSEHDDGPLFTAPSASAILGVNGSGKSTLIDALMIALLPFEGSLKLGVTNDVESGSAGGRTVRDYVLGKHSSTAGREASLASSMGRKDGCSIVLLVFQHNRVKTKTISIGRIWWYQNYVVSDSQLAFLAYDKLSIQLLCSEGKSPKGPKFFKQHGKEKLAHVQIFETMHAYFAAVSGSFGKISRDDLKILNRAFYVKSISQIDSFIRENMLIEQDSPHLDRLLENVRNGQEVALAIETCEIKIAFIERILKDLRKLEESAKQRLHCARQESLFAIFDDWTQLRANQQQIQNLAAELKEAESLLPEIRRGVADAERYYATIQSQIIHNDLDARLQKIEIEIKLLKERKEKGELYLRDAELKAKNLGLKLPKRGDSWLLLEADLDRKMSLNLERSDELKLEIHNAHLKKFELDREVKLLRQELEHLSRFKTLLPQDLYAIKEEAMKQLSIPASKIFFVGELLQVSADSKKFQRAIESVLFPISRNLLCHPDFIPALTKWLDQQGLKSDLIAKRIANAELNSEEGAWAGSARKMIDRPKSKMRGVSGQGMVSSVAKQYAESSPYVLDMIEILPERHHVFTKYLWVWLRAKFDYLVADSKDFRTDQLNLVTLEGLVKSDSRTMRKLKQNFRFSLGWDTAERIAELTKSLNEFNSQDVNLRAEIHQKEKDLKTQQEQKYFYQDIKTHLRDLETLETDSMRIEQLSLDQQSLIRENPDYKQLKEREAELFVKLKALQKKENATEVSIETRAKQIATLSNLLPQKERELRESLVYSRIQSDLGGEGNLVEALQNIQLLLTKNKVSKLKLVSDLRAEIQNLDNSAERSRANAAANLNGFKRDFNDPNLSYILPESYRLAEFVTQWTQAETRLKETELPTAQEKWRQFFDQIMMDSVKDTINEVKSKINDVERSILSINEVLKITNFEDLPDDQRYLKINIESSKDERIRRFRRSIVDVEKILGPGVRSQVETQSQNIMRVLVPFVEEFQKETAYRAFVTDVRNHFQFEVHSLRRRVDADDELIEIFTGSRRDAKSSAQTTQLAYALLASCLAYRFKFHDPIGSQETPRILILDEFGGKFDNEKPREILKLLEKMGFQSILVSPMSKADLLAEGISHLVFVHKTSATQSKVQSFEITSKSEYDRLVLQMAGTSV